MELRENSNYDERGTKVLFFKERERFPSFGFDPKKCSHPSPYNLYAEWEGPIGHGWFCALCGELVQVG